ncbi:MAG: hypothetical protein ABWX96_04615, partial [Propionibacteriaceae bacterium]
MRTLALVESPAQLVNVLEWAHQTGAELARLTTVVLAPDNEMSRVQLCRTAELAQSAGHRVRWCEPRHDHTASLRAVAALASELRGVDRLVVGDPFSGVIQLVLGVSRPREVVVVDDGSATLEFARLWTAGQSLVRWHSNGMSSKRRHIAAQARRRMDPSTGCRLTVFSCMPVQLDGADVIRNEFSWVRTAFRTPQVKPTADLIGTSLVETGVVEQEHYLRGIATLAAENQADRYFAHRKEGSEKLASIAGLGLEVVRPDLPLELVARRDVVGQTLISFPSTVVHTLPLVLA